MVMASHGEYKIRSVERAIRILKSFTMQHPEMDIPTLCQATGLPKSTVHRLVLVLEKHGLLERAEDGRTYRLSLTIFELGSIVANRMEVRKVAVPFMRELRDMTGETVALYVRAGNRRVCVETVESPQQVRQVVRPGERLPLYVGSSGKVLLAWAPEAVIRQVLAEADFSRYPSLKGKTIADLLQEIKTLRKNGYAYSFGERVPDGAGVSYPIRDRSGDVVAALTVLGPITRMKPERLEELLPMVEGAAAAISANLGFLGQVTLDTVAGGER